MVRYERILPGQGHVRGRALLEQMYRDMTGQAMPPIGTTSRGKPYFSQGTLCFSISHTRKHVFCVVDQVPVGIDAEEADRNMDLRLAQKILSPGELAQYQKAKDKRKALLTFWVLKEAAAKCSGQGLRGYPAHTDFSLEDSRVKEIDGCLVAVIKE